MSVSGIYKIEDAQGRVYIGSAVDIGHRWRNHKSDLRLNKHHSPYLQATYNKYGAGYFTFSVVEVVADKTKLLHYEQIWLDILFSSLDKSEIYNMLPIAGNSLGHAHSDETKSKIANKAKGNSRAAGRVFSQAVIDKMKQTHANNKALGIKRKRNPMSEETKAAISKAKRKSRS